MSLLPGKCLGQCLALLRSHLPRWNQSVSQSTNTEGPELVPGGKEASDASLPSKNQHLAGERKGVLWRARTGRPLGAALPCGSDILEGQKCWAGPAPGPGSQGREKENLGFIVWLFLISFCFRDPLLRENNALNTEARASLAGHPPSCGGGWALHGVQ